MKEQGNLNVLLFASVGYYIKGVDTAIKGTRMARDEYGLRINLIIALKSEQKDILKQIADECDLWMGGRRLDKGAYLAVSLFGSAAPADYEAMTARLCQILADQLGIPGDAVYVTYHPVSDWGWNGANF